MPRGGGGFRGGGFGGGGFRGGGFRGGGGGFRVGRVRSSGRPFGRTGARRTVSRSPRGSFHRRPHHRHWGGYYRPWWRRWWYWHWWWGYPYRPWYYAPVYWGGGVILAIIALLVILPIIGMAFIPFPMTEASSDGVVTYRDTQTLYYNEYWYEREYLQQGQTIEYFMVSQSPVTFIIWDQPFEEFPDTRTLTGTYSESMIVQGDHDYQYIGYFLKPGSILSYQFNVTSGGPIEFFIADANDLNKWNNWEEIDPLQNFTGSAGEGYANTFNVQYAQDWYLVWYNSGSSPVGIDFTVNYIAVNMFDFSQAEVLYEEVDEVPSNTLSVPRDGDWYFFIYFDPFINPAYSVDITFDVSYNTEVTYEQRWQDFTPILLIIGFIIVIILFIAIIQRRTAKKAPPPSKTADTTTTPETVAITTSTLTPAPSTSGKCHRCQFSYKAGDSYCINCGAKLLGRDYGTSKIITPANAKNCKSCGAEIKPDSRFCKMCGAKIAKESKMIEFSPEKAKSFFCQLDNEQHPATDSAYQCEQCSRMVCLDCYNNISKTGMSACPYCKGNLVKAQ